MVRRLLCSCLLVSLLMACGAVAEAPTATPSPRLATPVSTATPVSAPTRVVTPASSGEANTLWVYSGEGPAAKFVVVDLATGKELRLLPVGVVSDDWATLYTSDSLGKSTTVRAIDTATGTPLRSTTLDGDYRLPVATSRAPYNGLSRDGRTLVLAAGPSQEQAAQDQRSGMVISRFAILDTTFQMQPKNIELRGRFSYDTIAPDGRTLYLIEYPSSESPEKYGVRAYDLVTGTLRDGYIVDKSSGGTIMEGYPGPQVSTSTGLVFTLYRNEHHGPFIHALDTANGFAVCIDLPKEGKEDSLAALGWNLVLSANGQTLYAVNPQLGQIVDVDATGLRVRRTSTIPTTPAASHSPWDRLGDWLFPTASAKEVVPAAATLTADSQTLFVAGERGLLAIDTGTLRVRARLAEGTFIASILAGPAGAPLYAIVRDAATPDVNGTLVRLDSTSGELRGALPEVLMPHTLLHVGTGR